MGGVCEAEEGRGESKVGAKKIIWGKSNTKRMGA